MNISIMISTKNRPDFILRQIEYYSSSCFKGIILIGDSSNNNLFNETKKNITKHAKNLEIQHFHKPELTTDKATSFLCKQVKTDYCAFVADDDIILVNSLPQCVSFLDQHHEYSAVHGKEFLMSLETSENKPFGKVDAFTNYKMATIVKDNALERLEEFFDNILNVNMSVIRTSVNIDAYDEVNKLSNYHSSYMYGELVHASVVCARGKIGKVHEAFIIRQSHNGQQFKTLNLSDWFSDADWSNSYAVLKSTIEREILAIDDIDKDKVRAQTSIILSKWIKSLLNNYFSKPKLALSNQFYKGLKIFLKKLSFIKIVHKKITSGFDKKNIELILLQDLSSQKDINNYIDLVEKNIR